MINLPKHLWLSLFWILAIGLFLSACKSTESPAGSSNETSPISVSQNEASNQATQEKPTVTASGALSEEAQYQFQAFVKQGDAQYEAGAYRQALDFYKKAQAIAPEQIDKAKMIACIKALQEPSTREEQ